MQQSESMSSTPTVGVPLLDCFYYPMVILSPRIIQINSLKYTTHNELHSPTIPHEIIMIISIYHSVVLLSLLFSP